jgi:hypothetical protein
MDIRKISKKVVEEILIHPLQVKSQGEFKVFQSLESDKKHLIRIFVNAKNLVVTVYRTSKIRKYYEGKI